ncbi:MAG: glycoside hydrolase family 3 C-terminal domain-containing protein [Oscillospiraceae bacterium]|nr:glycoside hydrolase family 3 C-terminal domain-containing protein [Oscillospiraceae bacterium]
MQTSFRRKLALALCLALVLTLLPTGLVAFAADPPYTITFDTQGGSDVAPVVTSVDGTVAVPTAPTKDGYIFAGWYTSATPGRGAAPKTSGGGFYGPVMFSGITDNVTFYAQWIPASNNVKEIVTKDSNYKSGQEVKLGYSAYSGVELIDVNGNTVNAGAYVPDGSNPIFKDLNKDGDLDDYEDWRLTTEERAADLAAQLKADPDGVQQIAGLMLYSAHQMNWTSEAPSQDQITFLVNDDLRHVLIMGSAAAGKMDIHAKWNNNVQSIVEGLGYGIPANNSSDPRHGTSSSSNVEYYSANAGVSQWPSSLGMAATFDTSLNKTFGKIASIEYRALGIATALSPQIDIATDPRWGRFNGTFGEDPKLASAMSRAYVDGFQTTYNNTGGSVADVYDGVDNDESSGGWGYQSVNAMMKHWPGGGAGEGGRDAHYNYGKYAVFPGGNWKAHLIPFVDGSLSLEDGTEMATAVMPYYTISYLQVPGSVPNSSDGAAAKLNMANAYSDYMINGVLRDSYEFEGVVCTDWNVVGPATEAGGFMFDGDLAGMIWGVDDHYPDAQDIDLDGSYSNMAKRARLLLDAGVDQFGGLNTTAPIVKAYEDADTNDKASLLEQLGDSAYRLLKNIFRTGLFENPYLDAEKTVNTVGNDAFMKAGYTAQLKSMVLLKNQDDVLPLARTAKVYAPGADDNTVALLKSYFGESNVSATDATGATVSLVFLASVASGGGSRDMDAHVNSYAPINLDYKPYTAALARTTSVAGEPIRNVDGTVIGIGNRSYKGKTTQPSNTATGQLERLAAAAASNKPVIVVYDVSNPSVLENIEPSADAILVSFQSQKAAVLDILTGSTTYGKSDGTPEAIRPTGLLPMQFPKDMSEVEQQYEDVPRDMAPYKDSENNEYDFGFGLSWTTDATPTTVPVNASINPGYTEFVTNNQTPMTEPLNQGDGSSAYAIANRRRVTFDYGYKEAASDKTNRQLIKVVNSGSAVAAETPVRTGYVFRGWKLSDTDYNFTTLVTADITLMATWEELPVIGGGWFGTTVTHSWINAANVAAETVEFWYTTDGSDPARGAGNSRKGEITTFGSMVLAIIPDAVGRLRAIVYHRTSEDEEPDTYESSLVSDEIIINPVAPTAPGSGMYQPTDLESGIALTTTQAGISIYYTANTVDYVNGAPVQSQVDAIPAPAVGVAGTTQYTAPVAVPAAVDENTALVIKAIAYHSPDIQSNAVTFYYVEDSNLQKLTENNIDTVIGQMTLDEKILLLGGLGMNPASLTNPGVAGGTLAIPRLGIPAIALSDGPAGVRMGRNATVWMSPTGLASTWSTGAMEEVAARTAAEAKHYAVDIMLAPALNIQRNPLGGRDFEYYSEDPVVAGSVSAAYTRALQKAGVGVSLKHYAANNQENSRMRGDMVVSQRALREIYLRGFEIAAAEAPWTYMVAYNKINGVNASASKWLLTDVLRNDWGFDGLVMSDWGADYAPVDSIEAQMDLAEPNRDQTRVYAWVNEADISETERDRRIALIERSVKNILKIVVKTPAFKGEYEGVTTAVIDARSAGFKDSGVYDASKAVNRATAAEGMVLLKNDGGALPLASGTKLALVTSGVAKDSSLGLDGGAFGGGGIAAVTDLVIEGGGSAQVTWSTDYAPTLKEGLEEAAGFDVVSTEVDRDVAGTATATAATAAAAADVGVFVLSRTSSEGADNAQSSFDLSATERAVFNAYADAFKAASKKFIVLINAGASVNTAEFRAKADAILDVWLPGTEGANAIADILSGAVSPSGKLAQTFPITYEDSPSIAMAAEGHQGKTWATDPAYYDEGVYVGYRYFDTFGKEGRVAYPFGHGLSYTTFSFDNLTLSKARFDPSNPNDTITASVKVTNTGSRPGQEVAQLYLGASTYQMEKRPMKELKAYAKTGLLAPGASEIMTFTLNLRDLQYYNDNDATPTTPIADEEYLGADRWTVAEGTTFTVTVGDTSDNAALAQSGAKAQFTYEKASSVTPANPVTPPVSGPGVALPGDDGLGLKFPDAAEISDWARTYIKELVDAGILAGRANGTLDPKGIITRAEFTKMAVLGLALKAGEAPKAFADVHEGDWFKEFVDIASSTGIVQGVSDTAFAPDRRITRQDLCTIVYRALQALEVTTPAPTGTPFTDEAQVAAYALDAVKALKEIGVVSGRAHGQFDPRAYATREETAKILSGVIAHMKNA